MPRKTPTKNLDVVGPLEGMPHKVVDTFMESKQHNKLFVKPPNWDSPGDSIELLVLQNDRELRDMLKQQTEMRENAARQSQINEGRIEEITKIQEDLRKRFIDANSFFKECDDKRRAADDVVKQQKQLHEKLREEIKTTKESVQVLTEFRSVLQRTVDEYEPYERVINEVVGESDIWKTVKDCMDSCDALMLTQVEITETKRQKIIEIENLRQQMIKLTTDAAATLLGLNNVLTQLDREYGAACQECLYWEKILANVKSTITDNDLYMTRIQEEIVLMYRLICKRRGIECIPRKYTMEQLMDIIRGEIKIMREVLRLCTEEEEKKKCAKPKKRV